MSSVKQIQQELKNEGFDPGPIDDRMGDKTVAAIKAFQAKNHLTVDGIVGKNTAHALGLDTGNPRPQSTSNSTESQGVLLPWYEEARKNLGLKETHGSTTNPIIEEWLEELGAGWSDDETPWCGTFVGHCIRDTLPDEPIPANPFGARNWGHFGKEVAPQIGAVLVFWRESRQSGKGHVGFMAGEDATHYHVLGGNQSDSVSVARVPKDRFVTARWPSTAPFLLTGTKGSDAAAGEGSEA